VPIPTRPAGPSSFPPSRDSTGAPEYEKELNIGPAEAAAAEDQELEQLGEEVARVKAQKQRLQELQALEALEEEYYGTEEDGCEEAFMKRSNHTPSFTNKQIHCQVRCLTSAFLLSGCLVYVGRNRKSRLSI
jgi:hypothetical protein